MDEYYANDMRYANELRPGAIIPLSAREWNAMRDQLAAMPYVANGAKALIALSNNPHAWGAQLTAMPSPAMLKRSAAIKFADEVVARKPSMQVKKRGTP